MASRRKSNKPKRRAEPSGDADVEQPAPTRKKSKRQKIAAEMQALTHSNVESQLNSTSDDCRRLLCQCLLSNFDLASSWVEMELAIEQLSYPVQLQSLLPVIDAQQTTWPLLFQPSREKAIVECINVATEPAILELELVPLPVLGAELPKGVFITSTVAACNWSLVAVRHDSAAVRLTDQLGFDVPAKLCRTVSPALTLLLGGDTALQEAA